MKRKIVRLFTIEPFELEGLERSFQILENNFFGRQFVANVFEKKYTSNVLRYYIN